MKENNGILEYGTTAVRYVDAALKKAIEEGTASDHFYFTEVGDGKYSMHAKLPEYGCAGPGEPIFKIRENSNRLAKGFAQKFLDQKGNVDFKAGLRFTEEFNIRFGLDPMNGIAQNIEDPFASKEEAFKNAIHWLAKEINVPQEEYHDFSNFCRATFGETGKPAFQFENFIKIWSNFGKMGLAAEAELKEEVDLNGEKRAGLFYDPYNASDKVKEAYEGYMNAIEEIQDYARINPVTVKKMLTVNECSGSTQSNIRFAEMARQARREMGEVISEPEKKEFSIDIKAQDYKILSEAQEAKRKLSELIANPPSDPKDEAEYNRKLAELSEDAAVKNEKKVELEAKGERKWDFHFAPVIGEFTYNNERYYITTEAFAAESDQFMNHPGMTDGVEIGIFRSEEEFKSFYSKDDPHVQADAESEKLVTAKAKQFSEASYEAYKLTRNITEYPGHKLNHYADKITKQINDDINEEYCMGGWEKRYLEHQAKPDQKYEPSMGIDMEGISGDYDINFRVAVREGVMAQSRIDERYQKQFSALLTVLHELNSDMEMLRRAEYRNGVAYDMEGITETEKEILDKINDETINPRKMEAALARNEAGILVGAVIYGGEDLDNQSESRVAAKEYLEARLKAKGYTLQEMQDMARAINGRLLPPTEVRMDVQAGMARFASEFAAVKTLDASTVLSPQAKEFATHNFDVAFNAVFTKEKQIELAERGQTMFDYIFINGTSVAELYEDKYKDCSFAEKQDYLKMEVMNKILAGNGQTLEAVLVDQNGVAKGYPLHVTTNLPKFTNAVARTTEASKSPKENYEAKINPQLAHLSESKNWKLSGTLSGVVNDEAFETMKIYRNFGEGMSPEDRLRQGAAVIQAVTQKKVLDKNGAINRDTLETLMSNVCVNGVPMRNLLRGELNNDSEKQVIDMMAGYIAKSMDEKSDSLEHVSVISNGKHIPLTYIPPKAPEVTTKVNLFSSRETKAAHEREVLANEAALKRQEIWNEKNKRAAEACKSFTKRARQPEKERMSFAEFSRERSMRTRFNETELNNSKKLERSKAKEMPEK